MAYLAYEQVTVGSTVKDADDLVSASKNSSVLAELQADGQHIRYTMDDSTNPTSTLGMLLLTTDPPKLFTMEDVRRIRFTTGAADGVSAARLNVHYVHGRTGL